MQVFKNAANLKIKNIGVTKLTMLCLIHKKSRERDVQVETGAFEGPYSCRNAPFCNFPVYTLGEATWQY